MVKLNFNIIKKLHRLQSKTPQPNFETILAITITFNHKTIQTVTMKNIFKKKNQII